jgi:DNA-binding MarR family transcriptional regulator
MYDRELGPTGLELSQFTLLMTLDQAGEITQKALAAILAMDSTTLTRTLRAIIQAGWVTANPGEDRREKLLSLSAGGRKKFRQALPHWQRAQTMLRERLGEETWRAMSTLMVNVASAAIAT